MILIAGLGNPGKEYTLTRHNVGFMALDVLSKAFKIPLDAQYKKSRIGLGRRSRHDIVLQKPLTYMNLSGTVILSTLAKYRISPENFIVIHDDIDLPLGTIRIRKQGSSGGHKGIESILRSLNRDDFIRLRIGIGSPPPFLPAEDYVLNDFTVDEVKMIEPVLDAIPEMISVILKYSVDKAMNEFNRRKSIKNH
ncbi:MAG: aminoacyl-tRNA hydrolase [Spirochaetes bacterium]|nr:aminoacyl-tRNA hydrolase [Spirochaetota bacterium]